jgi:hypothetical protein
MTVLSAVQSAAIRCIGRRIVSVFSDPDQFAAEMTDLINEAATDIAKAHDWQRLMKLHTINGDGEAESFPLPADYDRMPIVSNLYSTRSQLPLARVRDLDQWLEFDVTPVVGYPGYWILLGGDIQIKPPLGVSENVKMYYLTRNLFAGDKARADVDGDEFLLPERLLTLALIWRWKAMKRLDYGEDMQNYNMALSEAAGKDKGSRILRVGRPRISAGVQVAYPGEVIV